MKSSSPEDGSVRQFRFVGLGDSLTEGVGDPRPGRAGFSGQLEGWVSHFASSVRASGRAVEVTNLAVAGARIEHVIAEQLPVALRVPGEGAADPFDPRHSVGEANPVDMMSCFIGINDLWDANLDFDAFATQYRSLFSALTTHAPVVLTATIHDVFAPFPMRAALRTKLNGNVARVNDIIKAAVTEFDLVLIDLAGRPEMFTWAVRAVDLLHPNRYGHQLVAAEVVGVLHEHGLLLDVEPPVAVPSRRGTADVAHVAWVGGYVKRNWRRWREEMAAAKARDTEAR